MLVIKQRARVLAIGAHPDDIELGAGGFISRLVHEFGATVEFLVLTDGIQAPGHGVQYPAGQRQEESRAAARVLCAKDPAEVESPAAAKDQCGEEPVVVFVGRFHDCTLDQQGHATIKVIEARLYDSNRVPRFDIVLTHAAADTHADHRAAHESTLSATRDFHGTILLYQAPSTKPNGFHPTLFVTMDEATVKRKVKSLEKHVSQQGKPFMEDARTRGLASSWAVFHRLPAGTNLEAFEVYKSFI